MAKQMTTAQWVFAGLLVAILTFVFRIILHRPILVDTIWDAVGAGVAFSLFGILFSWLLPRYFKKPPP